MRERHVAERHRMGLLEPRPAAPCRPDCRPRARHGKARRRSPDANPAIPPSARIAASRVSCGLKPESTSAWLGGDPVLKSTMASVPSLSLSTRSGRAVRRKTEPSSSGSSSEAPVSTEMSGEIAATPALPIEIPERRAPEARPDEARDLGIVHMRSEELAPDAQELLGRLLRQARGPRRHESSKALRARPCPADADRRRSPTGSSLSRPSTWRAKMA